MPATNSCINGSGRSANERIKSKRRLRVSTLPTSSAICSSNSSSCSSSFPPASASAPQVFCHVCVGGGGCICHVCFVIRACGGGGASAIAAYPHTPVLTRDFSTNDFSRNDFSTSHVQDMTHSHVQDMTHSLRHVLHMTHSLHIRHDAQSTYTAPTRQEPQEPQERAVRATPRSSPHPVAWGEDQVMHQDE